MGWFRRLLRDRRGNVLAITAASMPLILGGAAMAIDTIQLSVWKRQLQRAADSAAIAGAYAESQGREADDAVHRDLSENLFPTLSAPEGVVVGPSLGFERTVAVTLTAQRTVPFISFFTNSPNTITADATAALVNDGEFCLFSTFDEDSAAGIDANGGANVDLSCGMATNSRADNSVTAGGASSITASPISSVGGLNGETENFVGETTLNPYSAPFQDPFANVPLPTPPSGCDEPLDVGNGETRVLDPGDCFTSWTVHGTVQLPEGIYYVNGGNIALQAGGLIESTDTGGVTIIMTGDTTNADGDLIVGDFSQNGGGELDIDASESGDYRGIALYRDPRAVLLTVKINGGADTDIRGAIYMPGTDLWLGGNAGFSAQCLQVVARIITFRGAADIDNECPAGGASQAFWRTVVRLVA